MIFGVELPARGLLPHSDGVAAALQRPTPGAEPTQAAEPSFELPFDGRTIAFILLAFVGVWLAVLALTSLSPPVDDIEQLTWVRSLEWGYYKHPPLPTWLLWLPVRLFGLAAWVAYLMGAACTVGAVLILWRLLRVLRGPSYAGLALLASLCITYYNRQLNFYNHEVVLLLLTAASAWLCWQAFATGRLRWWLALGAAIGLGALAKYQVAVTLCCVLCFGLQQRAWRNDRHRLGALAASLTALLIFSPHIEWLRNHDFEPVHYAMGTSLSVGLPLLARCEQALHWLADQLLNRALPAWLLLAPVLWRARRSGVRPVAAVSAVSAGHEDPRSRAFLLIWGGVPLLFMPAVALVFGADLPMHWGAPFLLLAVPAAMELVRRETWERVDLARVLPVFLLLQAVLLATMYFSSSVGPLRWRSQGWRNVDSRALAREVGAAAREELGGPIRIVVGEPAMAGALSLDLAEHPLVLINGRFDHSPWIARDLLRRCGALQIGRSVLPGGAGHRGHAGLEWHVVPPERNAAGCTAVSAPTALRTASGEVG
jgi:hypothetical protein